MNNHDEALINDYEMNLVELACEPGSFDYKIELILPGDISKALPYINAKVDCIDYLRNEKFLSFRRGGIFCSMRPNLITIAMVHSREEALQKKDIIVGLLNDIWHRRANIEPKYTGRKPKPPTLSVYKLLPRTNCKECGLATCMAFASALANNHVQINTCPCLSRDEYQQSKIDLTELLEG